MNRAQRRILRALTFAGLSLLCACTLLQRPEPAVTLQLGIASAESAPTWPIALAPGSVSAVAALQSDRIIVSEGARLMQYQGLRWVDSAPVMLAEQLRTLRARNTAAPAPVAVLDLWLTDFNLRVAADGHRDVVVAASATLRCSATDQAVPLSPISADEALAGTDPQAIADAFNRATLQVVAALLAAADARKADCPGR